MFNFKSEWFQIGACVAYERHLTGEERVIKDVLRNYMSTARPAEKFSDTVEVLLNFTLTRIVDFDDHNDVVKVNAWLVMVI